MITVSGKTFEHRGFLKTLGGQWNAAANVWEIHSVDDKSLAVLRKTVGLIVTETNEVEPSISEILKRIFNNAEDENERPINGKRGNTAIYGDDQRYFNYFKDQNPLAFFGFSSLRALADFVDAIPHDRREGDRGAGWKRGSWSGTQDMAEALILAREGWPQGIANAQEVIDALSVPHALKRRHSYSVQGGHVNVGRMLSGDPAHMISRPKQPGRKIVTLFIESSAAAIIKVDNLFARAAIIAAITDILENEGYSCEIVATSTCVNFNNPGAQMAVTVKHAGEKLNLSDASFALGHPSFLRRFKFACVSQSGECREIWETQGNTSFAFDNHNHPTKANEFYIRPITIGQQNDIIGTDIRTRALSMLEFVKPHNLPVDIKVEW